ncbi:unnamed protein product [Merluccius merluccius]
MPSAAPAEETTAGHPFLSMANKRALLEPRLPSLTLCLGVLSAILLLAAVVIGVYYHVHYILELNYLRQNHSDVIKATVEAEKTLKIEAGKNEGIKQQLEKQKGFNDGLQSQIETVRAEKTKLLADKLNWGSKSKEGYLQPLQNSEHVHYILELNYLRQNHSDVIKATVEAEKTLKIEAGKNEGIKQQLEKQKGFNDGLQSQIETVRAEKTKLLADKLNWDHVHYILELNYLRQNHSDVIKATVEAEKTLKIEAGKNEGIKQQLEKQKGFNDGLQSQIETVRAEKTKLLADKLNWEESCRHCATGWTLLHSRCYYFATSNTITPKPWDAARESCVKDGGNLAVIDSIAKQEAMVGNPAEQQCCASLRSVLFSLP